MPGWAGWGRRVGGPRAGAVQGSWAVGDEPDGIGGDADYVDGAACPERLKLSHPWVREPLMEWLEARWTHPRTYRYRVEGSDLSALVVKRT